MPLLIHHQKLIHNSLKIFRCRRCSLLIDFGKYYVLEKFEKSTKGNGRYLGPIKLEMLEEFLGLLPKDIVILKYSYCSTKIIRFQFCLAESEERDF